ncbi:hypothetical protein [Haladaptatus sp. CMSO5]|uniref:hypothetical protein n=1 Tax=Haladaptatus sp. CMSO5 TaxID=3120514 RepID=UPI002FCE4F8B
MVEIQSLRGSMKGDVVRFFDSWNILGGIGVLLIGAISWVVGGFSTESVLVTVTGLYAFIAFNQMRESRLNQPASRLAVRPHFRQIDDSPTYDFGLKNFGDSPALNLRLKAILREGNDSVDTLMVSREDWHFHLEENQFISLITKPLDQDSFGDLTDADNPVFDNYEQKSIELYYTFESNNGIQYPRDWNKPMEMEIDEVVEKSNKPRTVKLAEIRKKCISS